MPAKSKLYLLEGLFANYYLPSARVRTAHIDAHERMCAGHAGSVLTVYIHTPGSFCSLTGTKPHSDSNQRPLTGTKPPRKRVMPAPSPAPHPNATPSSAVCRGTSSISAMRPPCYSFLEETFILGVIYGSLVWRVCNPAAPVWPRCIPGLRPEASRVGHGDPQARATSCRAAVADNGPANLQCW